jgi:hypothetical protein
LCVVLACAGAALLGGCAASKPGKGDGYFAVTAKQAQLYRFGPAQPTGADELLKQGRLVLMLRHEYGFSRVMTENGVTGYVANDFIAPAPPPEKPRGFSGNLAFGNLPPLPSRGTAIPGVSSANRAILQSDPLFGGDQATNSNAKPGFRFKVHAPSVPPADN